MIQKFIYFSSHGSNVLCIQQLAAAFEEGKACGTGTEVNRRKCDIMWWWWCKVLNISFHNV